MNIYLLSDFFVFSVKSFNNILFVCYSAQAFVKFLLSKIIIARIYPLTYLIIIVLYHFYYNLFMSFILILLTDSVLLSFGSLSLFLYYYMHPFLHTIILLLAVLLHVCLLFGVFLNKFIIQSLLLYHCLYLIPATSFIILYPLLFCSHYYYYCFVCDSFIFVPNSGC